MKNQVQAKKIQSKNKKDELNNEHVANSVKDRKQNFYMTLSEDESDIFPDDKVFKEFSEKIGKQQFSLTSQKIHD